MRIDTTSFALAGGLTFGLIILILTFIAAFSGYGANFLEFLYFYPFYTISFEGASIGFIWAFVNGFVVFGFFAWMYNHARHNNNEYIAKVSAVKKKRVSKTKPKSKPVSKKSSKKKSTTKKTR